MKFAKATTVKIARDEEEAHPSLQHPASCLCCGHVGEPAAWKATDPQTYVCVRCKQAADAAAPQPTLTPHGETKMSDKPKYTRGPWIATAYGDVMPLGANYLVASCGGKSGMYRNYEANARLIAAAPLLHDALQKAVAVLSGNEMTKQGLIDALSAARAALAA